MTATILICDDEAILRSLVRTTLDDGTHRIVEARDGHESIELARSVRPDLILLDMMMPGRNGIDVLVELRNDAALASIPVVMLTARAQVADREAALAAGAQRFMAKPFSPLELLQAVEELLEKP